MPNAAAHDENDTALHNKSTLFNAAKIITTY